MSATKGDLKRLSAEINGRFLLKADSTIIIAPFWATMEETP